MKMKLPMRFRILQLICLSSKKPNRINSKEIVECIFNEYGDERQCNEKIISTHLLALKSVGLIREIEVYNENNKLTSKFEATEVGIKRLKLIPKYVA